MIQAEAAVRHLARSYPYDSFEDTEIVPLIGDVDEINASLSVELQDRLGAAGVQVLEARLTDLSYAPEIAEAMLRRQQPSSPPGAKIVEGAVWMVVTPSPAWSRATLVRTRSSWTPIAVPRSRPT